jgi:2,4-dienoyl-CoA reductase-like NADH-dependent reductase (Old Yellow Enzyme family)
VDSVSSRRPSRLFTPLEIRSLSLRNRIVIPPMCQYSAHDGMPGDWHLVHAGRFATGGAGLVFVEATAVQRRGRITHGDVGLWSDEHIAPHAGIAHFIADHGAVPTLQLAHSGRKGGMQRPWFGNAVITEDDIARGDLPWQPVGASPIPVAEGWPVPHPLTIAEIADLVDDFAAAAKRAFRAGYQAVEVHGAHGYLIQSFLSPIGNVRTDAYGGDLKGRMRLALEVTEAVRGVWPDELPLFFRVSSVDDVEGGWTMDDTVVLARELKALGVDVIDCSSGGIGGSATAVRIKRTPGFQVAFAERVRRETGIMTMAVGLITHPQQAEEILAADNVDLIAVGREALVNPSWPLHAAAALGHDPDMSEWPEQYGWWLIRRQRSSEFYQPASSA